MNAIQKGGLLVIPRVTDMRNGFFRPEVVYSKGRASDIIFGDLYDNRMRAALLASLAARSAVMTQVQIAGLFDEVQRAVLGCHAHVERVLAVI